MNIDNIRVRVGKQYLDVYRDLTQDTATRHRVFQQHGDVFTLCAVVGYRLGKRLDCRGSDLFWSHSLNKHQQVLMIALAAAETNGYEVLGTPAEVIERCEPYAEAGMAHLLDNMLSEFVRRDEKGNCSVHYSDSDEVEKLLAGAVADMAISGFAL